MALLVAMLLLGATVGTPLAQDTGGSDQGQQDWAPVAQETEAFIPAAVDGTPLAQDVTNAVLAVELEAMILEQKVLPNGIQTLIEIPVSQDTYIASNKPNQNFGGAHELRVGWDGTASRDGALRAFLFFDVARYIPSRAVINHALLKGYQFQHQDNANMIFRGRHLLDSWNENLITWNSHQPHCGSVTGKSWIPPVNGWIEHDLTPLVKEWHNVTHPNHGLFVQGDETPALGQQRFFCSINAQNGRYPRLVVDNTVSTGTTPPVATVHHLPAWSPSSFTVSWSGSDTGGSGLAYTRALGDGEVGSGAVATRTYADVGIYTAVVTASNRVSELTATTTVTVDEAIARLEASNDSPTILGSATTCTATITAGSNVTYTWAFGDGAYGRSDVVLHTYPDVGGYTAVVTASNSVSLLTSTTTVTIAESYCFVYLPVVIRDR